MCPIVFRDDVMHINEWAGLNVKIWKCSFLVPMLTASGTYAVLLACVCMYVCVDASWSYNW